MRKPFSALAVRDFLNARDDLEILRVHYCYQIGSTFVNLSLMEDTIIHAMLVCDRIKVANLLGSDLSNWNHIVEKHNRLRSSTLGSLITILSKHGIARSDIEYLKWVKSKRDFFVHRFFAQGIWPGELNDGELDTFCRKLLYLEIIFARASHRIWKIFGRANLMACQDLGENGVLMLNVELFGEEGDKST